MKKILLLIAAAAAMAACSAPTKLVNTATYTKPIEVVQPATALMADLEVSPEKITYFMIPSKTVIMGGEENVIRTAVREALLANGNADVLIAPQYEIKIKGFTIEVNVSGYPAKYKNIRSVGIDGNVNNNPLKLEVNKP